MAEAEQILELEDVEMAFQQRSGLLNSLLRRDGDQIRAVDRVSFSVPENAAIGIIGESGCGKSTLLKVLMGLHDQTAGDIRMNGKSLDRFTKSEWKEYRRNVQIIFQDPFNSLDPKQTVRDIVREPLVVHGIPDKEDRMLEALSQAELQPAGDYLSKRPHQLSGGERQRVSIARALVLNPDVLLADEPVSMLDVSTQANILNLLNDLRDTVGMSIIYVSHDLSTVGHLCDHINVMYMGRVVESGPTAELLRDPQHPYTQALIEAIPIPDPTVERERTELEGSPRDPINLGEGCRFRDRCPERMDICETTPLDVELGESSVVACHLYYDHEESVAGSAPGTPPVNANGGS